MKARSLVVAILVVCGILWAFIGIRGYCAPQLYQRVSSPDGRWSLLVFRQRHRHYPVSASVDLYALATDASGKVLKRFEIDTVDLWSDVEANYPDLIYRNGEVVLGKHEGDEDDPSKGYWMEGFWKVTEGEVDPR